jgi:hypothetical protein
MANVKAVGLTIADNIANGSSTTMGNQTSSGGLLKCQVDSVECSALSAVGNTFRLARVPSNASIVMLKLSNDATTAGAVDIGLYKTAKDGGAVVDADAYASAHSTATATSSWPNQAYEARNVDKVRNEVWQDAGLSADPGIDYDIVLTVTTELTDAASLALLTIYTDGN